MIIFLDFDSTLFNTEAYKKETGTAGISCIEQNGLCLHILATHGKANEFLFSDTERFLKEHSRHRLVLLTFGDKEYQLAKVAQSGIIHLFQDTVFTGTEMKGDTIKRLFSQKDDTMVFLDDDLLQLQNMKDRCPRVVCIRMRRPGVVFGNDVDQKEFTEVSNLKEFAQLLTSF